MEKRNFGTNGFQVTALGFGAGHIGGNELTEHESSTLLNSILDMGINLIDTAKAYGQSEERIGKYISHRRNEFILSTKVGYGIPGHNDWTYACIIAGVDEALRMMKTDYIDIVHLHSCPLGTLEYGEVIDALNKTVETGKIRVAAYSGENEALKFAVESGKFGSVQTSINITDQRDLETLLPSAKGKGMGIIAKRPLANVPWRFNERPYGEYCEDYWLRWKKMNLSIDMSALHADWNEIALRFAAYSNAVDTCIVGTSNIDHLKKDIEIINKGTLPEEIYNQIREAFKKNNDGWIGLV